MPVTFHPSTHGANPVQNWYRTLSPSSALVTANEAAAQETKKILKSSLPEISNDIIPSSSGFLDAILKAYSQHHALIIRPDDVWIAILTQFNYYVNANAELLRSLFVAHDGQKKLTIEQFRVDWGSFAKDMTESIQGKLVDPELRAWLLPSFTTTRDNDTVVASIIMMANLERYFKYTLLVGCGLPRVTLEGEKCDWEDILLRASKLQEFGERTTGWYRLLEPVLKRFVRAFDEPNSEENIHFWQTVIHEQRNSSGGGGTSGWISAFFPFDVDGNWLGKPLDRLIVTSADQQKGIALIKEGDLSTLAIDGVLYHRIDPLNPPPATVSVDVLFVDGPNGEEYPCIMTAGVIGSKILNSGDQSLSKSGEKDTLQPLPGWWVSVKA